MAKANEASILDKKANISFSEVQMEDNHVNLKYSVLGESYIDTDGYIIPITMKEVMLTIIIRKKSYKEKI